MTALLAAPQIVQDAVSYAAAVGLIYDPEYNTPVEQVIISGGLQVTANVIARYDVDPDEVKDMVNTTFETFKGFYPEYEQKREVLNMYNSALQEHLRDGELLDVIKTDEEVQLIGLAICEALGIKLD